MSYYPYYEERGLPYAGRAGNDLESFCITPVTGGAGMDGAGWYGGRGMRWIYALIVLIIFALQYGGFFKRNESTTANPCSCGITIE
jgi:hypothetical protein